MKLTQAVYTQILETIGSEIPEKGGMLGSSDRKIATHFHYDATGASTEYSYTPNTQELNTILDKWSRDGIYLVGMVHSHNPGCDFPSCMDIKYAERILNALPHLSEFYLPILICEQKPTMISYKISIDENGVLIKEKDQIEIV